MRKPTLVTWAADGRKKFCVQLTTSDKNILRVSFSNDDILQLVMNRHPVVDDVTDHLADSHVAIDRELVGMALSGAENECNMVIIDNVRIRFSSPDRYFAFLDDCMRFLGVEVPETWE